MFRWHERLPPEAGMFGVEWAVTDRYGGVSRAPYGQLNLGGGVEDDPMAVAENRRRVATAFGVGEAELRWMSQRHGARTALAGPPGEVLAVDGIGTDDPRLALGVLVADCTPVLLVDRRNGWCAAVHAGRPGMIAGVVPATIDRLRSEGAADLEAVVGPSVCPRCYEVPEQMREDALAVSPCAAAVSWTGTPAIDVAGAVVDQVARAGLPVRWLPGCSRESDDLYSYRGEGRTGRYAGIVRLLAPGGAA